MSRFLINISYLIKCTLLLVLTTLCMSMMLDQKASPELKDMAITIDNLSELDSVHNIAYIDKALAMAREEKCDTLLAFTLLNKATLLAYHVSPQAALECLEALKTQTEKTGHLESCLYDAWFNVIMLSRSNAETTLAMQEITKMLSYAKENNSHYGMSTAYCLFADMYETSYDTAVENLELALEHLIKGGFTEETYEVYYQLAYLAMVHHKPDDVLKNTQRMLESRRTAASLQVADHLNLQAYCQLDDREKAQKIYERIQNDWDNGNIGIGATSSAIGALCAYHSKYGDPNKIPELLPLVSEGNNLLKLQMEIIYAESKNDYKRANELLKETFEIEKEKMLQLQEAEVATVNTIYHTAELKEAKQQLEIEEASTRNQRNLVIIIALTIMLATALYIVYTTNKHNVKLRIERDNTEQQRQIAEQQRQIAEEQRQIAEHNRQIAEEERNNAVRLNELKTQFLNTMSHEMRTPLNSIIGFNDILHNSNLNMSPEKRQEMIGHINFHSKQLMQLLDHVVILSRIDCNDAKPVAEDINLHDIIENLYDENVDRVDPNVNFEMDNVPDDLMVKTDSEFATIILREIIDNAIKFTKEGFISISAVQTNNGAKVTIKDSGCGLPMDKLDLMYNRFEKFTKFEAGFGLGMSCCKELVDIINSKITIDESYHQGASFTVEFINLN